MGLVRYFGAQIESAELVTRPSPAIRRARFLRTELQG